MQVSLDPSNPRPVPADVAPVLQLDGITKTFPGVKALSEVSLSLYPGQVTALVGENGAGKSTIVKTLTGILQPNAGTITLDGKSLPDALVLFEPVTDETNAEQRLIGASVGRSNKEGVYTLAYPGGHDGAVVGTHTVRVNKTDVKGLETLSKKYHRQSQMKHEVKAGSNTIDLPLRSKPAGTAAGKRTADPPTP